MIWLERISAAVSRFAGILAGKFLHRERPVPPAPPMPPMLPMPSMVELPRPIEPAPTFENLEKPAQSEKLPAVADGSGSAQFYFRETILDDLELYMRFIRRMRLLDPDAYGLFSRIGARVLPVDSLAYGDGLEPWFAQMQPGFGCVAIGINKRFVAYEQADKNHGIYPRFMYFTKYIAPPAAIQRVPGRTVYLVTAFFDPANEELALKRGHELQFAVSIDRAGRVAPLKIQLAKMQVIPSKRHGATPIAHKGWGWCPGIGDWAADHKQSVEAFQVNLFATLANAWVMSHASMIHVTASNAAGLTAAFGVDIKRTPYFFADRETVVNERGRKARIFHLVRGHRRTSRSGKSVNVRMHFAGLRRFKWNGYEINISVPGWHHKDIAEWTTGAFDQDQHLPVPKGMIDWPDTGKFLAAHVRNGWQTLQRAGSRAVH